MLKLGADPNAYCLPRDADADKYHSDTTPLLLAVDYDNAAMVTLLPTHGADPSLHMPGIRNFTLLLRAAGSGHLAALRALIDWAGRHGRRELFILPRA